MLTTVYLDNQLALQAHEIEDVITKRVLTAKLETRNLPIAQNLPQSLFASVILFRNLRCNLFESILLFVWPSKMYPIPTLTPPLEGEGKFWVSTFPLKGEGIGNLTLP